MFTLVAAIGVLGALAFRNPGARGAEGGAGLPSPQTRAATADAALPAAAASPARGHAIYRDGLENAWQAQGWTWAKDVVYDDTAHPHSGRTAIKVRFQGYDGLKFHHDPLDTRPFDRITFWAYGGPEGGQRVQLGGVCSEKENTGAGVALEPLPAGRWVSVTVPLAKLGLAGKPDMTAFWIQGASDKPQTPLWVDEVRLLLPGESAPAGPALGIAAGSSAAAY
jgi:hypothetical protein